jgi:hypothetical protein
MSLSFFAQATSTAPRSRVFAPTRLTVLRLLRGEGIDGGRGTGSLTEEMQINGTVPGRALQIGEILPASAARDKWSGPLLDGTERIGVLRVTAAEGEARAVRETRRCREMRDPREMAAAVAMLLANKRVTSDAYARLVRRRRMNVAAEMEWRLMPPQRS